MIRAYVQHIFFIKLLSKSKNEVNCITKNESAKYLLQQTYKKHQILR